MIEPEKSEMKQVMALGQRIFLYRRALLDIRLGLMEKEKDSNTPMLEFIDLLLEQYDTLFEEYIDV